MANTVQIRNSSTAAATPSSLEAGELAINTADATLFWEDSSGAIQTTYLQPNLGDLADVSDTVPSPNTSVYVLANVPGVGWSSQGTIGSVSVGSQPIGGWPSGSVGESLAGKASTSHASTHATGGSDAIAPADIGAAPAASPTFTGVTTVSAGTVAAPALVATGDANTGVYFPAADTFAISTAGVERLRVEADGRMSFGAGGSGSTNGIQLNRSLSGGSGVNGLISAQTVTSEVTSSASVFRTFVGTQAASFTLAALTHFRSTANTFGAGSTVTTQIGFQADNSLTGATNNYGFRGDIADGTGRWNFYGLGTAPNFFAGNVGVGSDRALPASALDVNGVITVSAGSAAAPAVVASGDANTGVYFPAADTFAISTAGSERLRVDDAGLLVGKRRYNYPIPQIVGGTYNTDQIVLFAKNGTATVFNGRIDLDSTATSNEYTRNYFQIELIYRTSGTVDVAPQVTATAIYNGNQALDADNLIVVKVEHNGEEFWGLVMQGLISYLAPGSPTYTGVASSLADFQYGYANVFTSVAPVTPNPTSGRTSAMFRHQDLVVRDGSIDAATLNVDGVITVSAGSAAAPSYSFYGDTNTGTYSPAADTFAISTGGTERLRVDSSGRVGIGSASPSALLDINADKIRLRTAKTPASASDTGNAGDICWDASYLYICTATNTWRRIAHSTW